MTLSIHHETSQFLASATSDAAVPAVVDPLLAVEGASVPVPLAAGRGTCGYANLDYAASAPSLSHVERRLAEFRPFYASVHRGAGWASQVSTAAYEGARTLIARFLGAREEDVLVFTRNTTDALNLLASSVPAHAGDVIVLELEHHANLLPWQRGPHRVLPVADTLAATLDRLADALAEAPAALVSITGASNVTGEEMPLARIATLAHAHGARLAVDAAQLAPHRRIDLAGTGIDYLALSGHKLYAPYGAGVLIGQRDWLDEATPYLAGGGAVRSVATTSVTWAAAPARHEAGTPNVLGAVALAAACEAFASLPEGALEVHESALRHRLVTSLSAIDGVHVVRIFSDSTSSIGVVTFTVDGIDPGLLAAVLSAEYGIGVRDGKFCAHPLLARLGLPAGAVRASLGVGSSSDDVDRLVRAVASVVQAGPQLDYQLVDGRYAPVDDTREMPAAAGWLVGWAKAGVTGASPCQSA